MFRPLLDAVAQMVDERDGRHEPEHEKRARVQDMIIAALPAFYIGYQKWPSQDAEAVAQTVKYLTDSINILFDSEAEEECMEDHDGGSWMLNVNTGKVIAF
tara:strand:- start:864 stop:1166 length:303 start_codon:yes stop_codon:yes gene_type:complete